MTDKDGKATGGREKNSTKNVVVEGIFLRHDGRGRRSQAAPHSSADILVKKVLNLVEFPLAFEAVCRTDSRHAGRLD